MDIIALLVGSGLMLLGVLVGAAIPATKVIQTEKKGTADEH